MSSLALTDPYRPDTTTAWGLETYSLNSNRSESEGTEGQDVLITIIMCFPV